ncbi:class I SAM-dependent methyltransferase [Wenzhouxiangella sp. EGI_FJ10305]|uniref:hypothetical protein n=1 Tax=Wenzhouxiangella sp. EGI_FJ10305 TaxID=3243768 RepID=UPI0035D75FB8
MDWIEDQLNHARTPETIVHLGAGLCRELPHYVSSGAGRIVLLEPNPEALPELRQRTSGHDDVEVLPMAVSAEEGKKALRIYNYPDLSSLRRPTGLFQLLPGLQQTRQAIVDVIRADKLPAQLGLEGSEDNWLVIDTPGEESAIVSALAQHAQLHHFDRIIIRAGADIYYDGAATAEELAGNLEKLGYYREGADDSADGDWPRSHLRLNAKAIECRRLRRENEFLAQENKRLKEQTKKLTEKLQVARKQKEELEAKSADLNARLEQLDQQPRTAELLAGLQKTLSREIHQSRVQIESYMALNKYLDYGEFTPALHGWTISPDLAVYLVELLENENYDLIIEFGSGSSTVLLAQAVEQRATKIPRIGQLISQLSLQGRDSDQGYARPLSVQRESAAGEVPNRVLAFEHSRNYLEKTENLLSKSGVGHFVDLEYSPLRDFEWGDREYLFYHCSDSLERAARMLQRKEAKVLVLVDGPPGNTNSHTRFPALPILLENFSRHELHVVLDDYERKEEKEIVEMWQCELERRSLEYDTQVLSLEKGCCFLRINQV